MSMMEGVYLPLVTPFHDGDVDMESLRRLVQHYSTTGISGLIMLGTTGESPTVDRDEQRAVVQETIDAVAGSLPVYVGVSGNSTRHVGQLLESFEPLGVEGYLMVTPYYNRPSDSGLVEHFRVVAGHTARPIIVYNVPYRTGVNLSNDALLELVSKAPNIRAVKDSTGNITQSLDLLQRAPQDLAVLTGEDMLYFTSLANGAAGGILASAHLATRTFVDIYHAMSKQELVRARGAWHTISPVIPTLFCESNPMPLKYCLWRQGLLRSPECRLPLTKISDGLAKTLDDILPKLPD